MKRMFLLLLLLALCLTACGTPDNQRTGRFDRNGCTRSPNRNRYTRKPDRNGYAGKPNRNGHAGRPDRNRHTGGRTHAVGGRQRGGA